MSEEAQNFGGAWTEEKLKILEKYLDTYTTALKNKPFKLVYIDAFAGTGEISEFGIGSVKRAIAVKNRPFDNLIFVESDTVLISAKSYKSCANNTLIGILK